uniref:Uncharacterized protein n=1 Tax=Daucus carota subsp. sativus TaxID=79200 RepID=A0A166FCR9_DAUCS
MNWQFMLQINPDSAKGYKSRGMARAMLGQWEVEPIVLKIKEHQRRYARLRKESNHEEAIELLTQAILLNPTSAMMYATRVLCTFTSSTTMFDYQINPDSAKGHKSRGMARAMLGQWEEAVKDLHAAYKKAKRQEKASSSKRSGGMRGGFPGNMPGAGVANGSGDFEDHYHNRGYSA